MKKYYALCRVSDGIVEALDQDVGAVPSTLEYKEIDRQTYGDMASNLFRDSVVPIWKINQDGTVENIADTRSVIEVQIVSKTVSTQSPTVLSFTIKDSNGDIIRTEQGVKSIIVTSSSSRRRVGLSFNAGQATVNKTFEAGEYVLETGDPQAYRLSGDTSFEVVELW